MTGIEVQRVSISRQHAFVSRRQMQNHHKRHAAIGRHVVEKTMERIDAAGRGADADERKIEGARIGRQLRCD